METPCAASAVNISPTPKAVVQTSIVTKATEDNSLLVMGWVVGGLWSSKLQKVPPRLQSGCSWEDQTRFELPQRFTSQQCDLLSGHWVAAGTSPTQDLPTAEADTSCSQPPRPCSPPSGRSSRGQAAHAERMCGARAELRAHSPRQMPELGAGVAGPRRAGLNTSSTCCWHPVPRGPAAASAPQHPRGPQSCIPASRHLPYATAGGCCPAGAALCIPFADTTRLLWACFCSLPQSC